MDAVEQSKLEKFISSTNICKHLDATIINELGQRVVRDYDEDEQSRKGWLERNKSAMGLATQVIETKNFPWPGAANIKFPLLATACVQFSSRAMPNIVQGTDVVRGRVIGKDENGEKAGRASRVGEHMSYQMTDEMEEWSEDMDSLLVALPIEGAEFKKTRFDVTSGQNVSEHVRPIDLVVNYRAKSLRKASRISHRIWLYPNQVEERIRAGVFRKIDLGLAQSKPEAPASDEDASSGNDEDAPHLFIEQHRSWDLDGDGYQEPYICTVHKDTSELVRVVARWDADGVKTKGKKILKITPVHYFTRFLFMPDPDGGIYGMGFGTLQGPINKTINSVINQLLDAGTRRNTGGGFIGNEISLKRGQGAGVVRLKLGEYKQVNFTGDDIKKGIVTLDFPEPSRVLFMLLGTMIEAGKEVASVSEVLTGEQRGANVPATTTLALIEQGLKVFTGIYIRIHRALKREFKKLYRLNRLFLEDEVYFNVLDNPKAIKRADYDEKSLDVVPVSNPKDVSETQKLLKAELLRGLIGQGYNDKAIRRRYLEALQVDRPEELLPPEDQDPPLDPKITLELQKLELERDKHELDVFEARYRILKMQADTIAALARAEAAEQGPQLEMYKAHLTFLEKEITASQAESQSRNQQREGGQANE